MQRLIQRFSHTVRIFAAVVVSIAFLFASLTTAVNAYPDLSSCLNHSGHASHSEPIDSDHFHESKGDHHNTDADTHNADGCCGTCDGCNNYFDAHLQGLNIADTCASLPVPQLDISTSLFHVTKFTSRPNLPPPRLAFIL